MDREVTSAKTCLAGEEARIDGRGVDDRLVAGDVCHAGERVVDLRTRDCARNEIHAERRHVARLKYSIRFACRFSLPNILFCDVK